jgi:hypothetical protein
MHLQTVYLNKVSESLARIGACESFLIRGRATNDVYSFESAVLQARKALEAIAFAAIAPNKTEYEAFRAEAEKPADYRKDYNARAILQYIGKVNKDFYPTPLQAPTRKVDGTWHFERRSDGFLTKQQFESIYDRLGKFLHADNPWGKNKGIKNLIADLPGVITGVQRLFEWHFTVIRTPQFQGVWVVEAARGSAPRIVVGKADGDFIVQ